MPASRVGAPTGPIWREVAASTHAMGEDSWVSLVVDVHDLHVRFGTVVAVEGIDLTLPAGSSVALVGRNGAGKSTTLRVLAGVLPPTAGDVHIAGLDIRTDRQGVKERVG